jgi:hypothetical protein
VLVVEEQKPMNLAKSDRASVISLRATARVLRVLIFVFIAFLCATTDSPEPAIAFSLTLGPSVLFVAAFMAGALKYPIFLNSVHPLEPTLYHWLGVGFVKRVVATRIWPELVGVVPPRRPTGRTEFLNSIELSTQGAEICHWPTFVIASGVALLCLVLGRTSLGVWIVVFNVILNAYPIMLQRSNRWRVHRIREHAAPERATW